MKRFKILLLIFFAGISKLISQTENNKLKIAEDLFSHSCFSAALPLYQDLLKLDSVNSNLNFKIGICYFYSRSQKTKSVYYLEKVISSFKYNSKNEDVADLHNDRVNEINRSSSAENTETQSHYQEASILISAYKILAEVYHSAYKFDLAIASYEKLKNSIHDSTIEELINREIALCKFGGGLKSLIASPLSIDNTCKNINYFHRNYPSSLIFDPRFQLFTSHLNETKTDSFNRNNQLFEDVYINSKTDSLKTFLFKNHQNSLSRSSGDSVVAYSGYEATVGASVDGQFVLIYKVENGYGNLYTTSLRGNQWTMPEELSKTINIKGWEEDEFISADGTILYFSSDCDGGFGGKDIYKCNKMENGKWGKAKNLGPSINTSFDDETPFIYPDGNILYFSSNRNKDNGSFDIFFSTLSDKDSWISPVNVGYPINKSDHEFSDTVVYEEKTFDNKNTPLPAVKINGYDQKNNFIVTFYNEKKTPITLLKGTVVSQLGMCIKDLKITVIDNNTEEVLGVYYSNSKTGHYSIILPEGRSINITYEAEGYVFQSEHIDISKDLNYYKIHKTIEMSPVAKGAKVVLNNLFFDFENPTISSGSNTELNNLFLFLTNNPDLIVELAYYNGSEKKGKFNKQIALSRVQAVVNYLNQKGINRERIIGNVYTDRKTKKSNKKNTEVENLLEGKLNPRLEMRVLKINSKPNSSKSR